MLILKHLKHDHYFVSIHPILTYLLWAWIYDIKGFLFSQNYFSFIKFQGKKKSHFNTKNKIKQNLNRLLLLLMEKQSNLYPYNR